MCHCHCLRCQCWPKHVSPGLSWRDRKSSMRSLMSKFFHKNGVLSLWWSRVWTITFFRAWKRPLKSCVCSFGSATNKSTVETFLRTNRTVLPSPSPSPPSLFFLFWERRRRGGGAAFPPRSVGWCCFPLFLGGVAAASFPPFLFVPCWHSHLLSTTTRHCRVYILTQLLSVPQS